MTRSRTPWAAKPACALQRHPLVAVAQGVLLVLASLAGSASAADRPNVVWVSCEDISPHLGCYGDPHATTPHIDRLASEGVRYTHAFVAAGVCAPCRSTIITGMYQTSIGTQHMRCTSQLPDTIRPFTMALRESGYYCTNNSKRDYQFDEPKATWDESSGKAHWRNRPRQDQPFFSVFNFTECHESGIASDSKYEQVTRGIERHDPQTLTTLPPYYPDTPVVRADWGRYYDVVTAMDRRVGEILQQLQEDGLEDETIVVYWSDHGVGLPRAKRWLYDSGMRVPLIVRVPAKWQSLSPAPAGTTTDRLVSLMDLGPSMLQLAGLAIPSHVQGRPFLGSDLPPPRKYVYGARDRMDERYDIIRAVRNRRFKYIRNYEPFKTYYQYMNTPEKGRLMREIRRLAAADALPAAAELFMAPNKPIEELYDTEVDPHEIRNLANDPAHQEILAELRAAHLDWVTDTGDLGLIPEPELVAREARLGSRYAILRQSGAEDLVDRLRDAASASLDGNSAAEQLISATKDADPAVRYWGVVGLGNLTQLDDSQRAVLRKLLADEAPVVRVTAARVLCRQGEPDAALQTLVAVLREGAQWERLYAINALDQLDELALPVLPEMKAALEPRNDLEHRGKYTVRVANRAVNDLEGTDNQVP